MTLRRDFRERDFRGRDFEFQIERKLERKRKQIRKQGNLREGCEAPPRYAVGRFPCCVFVFVFVLIHVQFEFVTRNRPLLL